MTWSKNMGFENPAMTVAQKRCEAAEAEVCRLVVLSKSKIKKYRDDAKKHLPTAVNAALRAAIKLERLG